MIAGNLAQTVFVSVSPYQSTSSAEELLVKHKYLVVKDDTGHYLGVLIMADLITYSHNLVIDCVSGKPAVDYYTPLDEILAVMETKNYFILPVCKDDEFYGVISYKDIIAYLNTNKQMNKGPLSDEPDIINLLSAGVIHDYNNILAYLTGLVYSEDRDTLVKAFEEGIMRVRSITEQYMKYLRTGVFSLVDQDIVGIIKDAVAFFIRSSKYQVEYDLPDDVIRIYMEPAQFMQLVSNLLLNALQAMPAGGKLYISVNKNEYQPQTTNQAEPFVRIAISDSGGGVPPAIRDKIFQPFFTTKTDGSGMGLALVRAIVKQHRGVIELKTPPHQGACFEINLPIKGPA